MMKLSCLLLLGFVAFTLAKPVREEMLEELETVDEFKENCFPRPGGGCRCVETDSEGNEEVLKFSKKEIVNCLIEDPQEDDDIEESEEEEYDDYMRRKRETDKVAEKAKANYDLVVQELKAKFKNMRENCYPLPKGCRCSTGTDKMGQHLGVVKYKGDDIHKCYETPKRKATDEAGAGGKRAKGGSHKRFF